MRALQYTKQSFTQQLQLIPRTLHRLQSHASTELSSENDSHIQFQEIPGPLGLPYLGSYFSYKSLSGTEKWDQYHKTLMDKNKIYGGIFKETLPGSTKIFIFEPEMIRKVFKAVDKQSGKMPIASPLVESTKLYREKHHFSPGLGNSNGEEWYKLRKAANAIMLKSNLSSSFLPHVNEVAEDFIRHWENKLHNIDGNRAELEINNDIIKWVLESSVYTAYGKRLHCFNHDLDSRTQNVIDATKDILNYGTKLGFSLRIFTKFPWLSLTWQKFSKSFSTISKFGDDLFHEAAENITNLDKASLTADSDNVNWRYTFIAHLMQQPDIQYKDMVQLSMSLWEDGLITTGPTTIWHLYNLARNPDKQEKLYEEICQLQTQSDGYITLETLQKAKYLKACIKETLRMYPIGIDIARTSEKDIVIDNYLIPAGTDIRFTPNLALMLPEYVENPDQYIPERWIRDEMTGKSSFDFSHIFLPFSFGPRGCIGKRISQHEMMIILIKIIQKFRLEYTEKEEVHQVYKILLHPAGPVKINFTPRETTSVFEKDNQC